MNIMTCQYCGSSMEEETESEIYFECGTSYNIGAGEYARSDTCEEDDETMLALWLI